MGNAIDPVLSTKLRPSQVRAKLVPRPRLIERLSPEPGRKLTLVSAPAGFGKTTLLGRWAQNRAGEDRPVAWLSLDKGDGDPVRFMSHLVAALRRGIGDDRFGEVVLAALRAPEPPRVAAVAGALINELAALPHGLDLVLDDCHAVDNEDSRAILAFLTEHLPEGAHLVLSGRVDPPLPLARLRARGQLVELRAADLAFTAGEAAAFLRGVMGLDLSAGEAALLEGRTEGWIAALQLAALSMRGREDPSGFVETFSGTNRDVWDFLAEEVLDGQTEERREFLLATSILDGLTGPLCDALTGRTDGQRTLERLERENLFVVALDEDRRWYRYHHLFAEFLRGRLTSEDPGRVGELHLRASGWYADNGQVAAAIEHALVAPDHELAARLIAREILPAWSRGEVPSVLRWLETLPTEAKHRRPWFLTQHALALALTGRPGEVEPILGVAEQLAGVGDDETRQFLLGSAAAVRAWCSRLRGDTSLAVGLARRALAILPEKLGALRTFAAVCLGDALWTTGDLAAAGEALAAAIRIGRSAGHIYATLSAMTLHVRVQVERGRLREADETLREALRFATEQRFERLPAAGAIYIGTGALHYERNALDEAERALETGIELAKLTGNVTDLVWGYVTLSRAQWARRAEGCALELAREADRVARGYGADLEIAITSAWMARLRLAQGTFEDRSAFEQDHAPPAEGAARAVNRIARARVLHAGGRHHEALGLLDESRAAAASNGRTRDLVEVLVLQALVLRAAGERGRAAGTAAEALALAAPEGYVRTFVDAGQPLAALLADVLEGRRRREGVPPRFPAHYPKRILTALEADAAVATPPDVGLPDPPSARELEVLRLIAAGGSNRRIAAELYVSVGTVKTHINNLYRKLTVHSRTEALARARELKLL